MRRRAGAVACRGPPPDGLVLRRGHRGRPAAGLRLRRPVLLLLLVRVGLLLVRVGLLLLLGGRRVGLRGRRAILGPAQCRGVRLRGRRGEGRRVGVQAAGGRRRVPDQAAPDYPS